MNWLTALRRALGDTRFTALAASLTLTIAGLLGANGEVWASIVTSVVGLVAILLGSAVDNARASNDAARGEVGQWPRRSASILAAFLLWPSCSTPDEILENHRQEGEYAAALATAADAGWSGRTAVTADEEARKARVLAAIAGAIQAYLEHHDRTTEYLESLGILGNEAQALEARDALLEIIRVAKERDR